VLAESAVDSAAEVAAAEFAAVEAVAVVGAEEAGPAAEPAAAAVGPAAGAAVEPADTIVEVLTSEIVPAEIGETVGAWLAAHNTVAAEELAAVAARLAVVV